MYEFMDGAPVPDDVFDVAALIFVRDPARADVPVVVVPWRQEALVPEGAPLHPAGQPRLRPMQLPIFARQKLFEAANAYYEAHPPEDVADRPPAVREAVPPPTPRRASRGPVEVRAAYEVRRGVRHPQRMDLGHLPTRSPAARTWVARFVSRVQGTFDGYLGYALAELFPGPEDWEWDDAVPADGTRRGVPRRRWDRAPSLYFPDGLNPRWRTSMIAHGLRRFGPAVTVGMPRQLGFERLPQWAARLLAPFVPLRLERDGASCTLSTWTPPPGLFTPSPVENLGWEEVVQPWLALRVLNGMGPAPLVKVDGAWEARYSFRDLPFGGAPGRDPSPYHLPDVAVRLAVPDPASIPTVTHVRVAYRDPHGAYPPSLDWTVDMVAAPLWLRRRAARVAACAMYVQAQLDQHVARGHLVPELIAGAVRRTLSDDNPVYRLLWPRLQEVDAVNRAADAAIWGPYGALAVCTPLPPGSLAQRMRDRMGALDWKGYRPPSTSIGALHYAPRVFSEYWDRVVAPYVDAALSHFDQWYGGLENEHRAWTDEVAQLFTELHDRSVPWRAWDGGVAWDPGPPAWLDAAEFRQQPPAHGKACSPLDPSQVKADVVQLCTFAIFHSTLAHSWANVRQTLDAGDPEHAVLALRRRLDPHDAPSDPDDDAAWHAAAAPVPCDLAYQRAMGQTLTQVPVDTFESEVMNDLSPGVARDPARSLGGAGLAERAATWLNGLSLPVAHQWGDYRVVDLDRHLSRSNR